MIQFSGKTTRTDIESLTRLFGPNVPVEAVNIVFDASPDMTLGDVRDQIEAMAEQWDQAKFHLDRLTKARDSVVESVAIVSSRLAEADPTERVYLIGDLDEAAKCLEDTDQDLQHLRGEGE